MFKTYPTRKNNVSLTGDNFNTVLRTRGSWTTSVGEASPSAELGRPLVSALVLALLVVGVTRALFFIRVVRTEVAEQTSAQSKYLRTGSSLSTAEGGSQSVQEVMQYLL